MGILKLLDSSYKKCKNCMYCFQDYKQLYSDITLPVTVSPPQWNGPELFQTGMQMAD